MLRVVTGDVPGFDNNENLCQLCQEILFIYLNVEILNNHARNVEKLKYHARKSGWTWRRLYL